MKKKETKEYANKKRVKKVHSSDDEKDVYEKSRGVPIDFK